MNCARKHMACSSHEWEVLYGALCSPRALQGERADAGVHYLLYGSLHPLGCSGWGAGGRIKVLTVWLVQ